MNILGEQEILTNLGGRLIIFRTDIENNCVLLDLKNKITKSLMLKKKFSKL